MPRHHIWIQHLRRQRCKRPAHFVSDSWFQVTLYLFKQITLSNSSLVRQLDLILSTFLANNYKTELLQPYGVTVDAFFIVDKDGVPQILDKFYDESSNNYEVDSIKYFKFVRAGWLGGGWVKYSDLYWLNIFRSLSIFVEEIWSQKVFLNENSLLNCWFV